MDTLKLEAVAVLNKMAVMGRGKSKSMLGGAFVKATAFSTAAANVAEAGRIERDLGRLMAEPVLQYLKRRVRAATTRAEVDAIMNVVTGTANWRGSIQHSTVRSAARVLEEAGRAAIANPYTRFGRSRLQREFRELTSM